MLRFLDIKKGEGEIELSILDSIKISLSSISQNEFKPNDILLINYYPGDDLCSTYSYKANFKSKQKEYYRKVEKIENIKQFFIYKSHDGLKRFGAKINWIPDENNLIEKVFYPIHYPCGGYVIIDSKGNYISQRGEYCYSDILIDEIKTFANGYK